jgi:hypothetical protein
MDSKPVYKITMSNKTIFEGPILLNVINIILSKNLPLGGGGFL